MASKMASRLNSYQGFSKTNVSNIAAIFDPQPRNTFDTDGPIIRATTIVPAEDMGDSMCDQAQTSCIIDDISYNSLHEPKDDEVTRFLHATAIAHNKTNPLKWWVTDEGRFPTITKASRNYLCVQASSVSSESALSMVGNLIDDHRSKFNIDSATVLMCSRSWIFLVESMGKNTI